MSVTGVPAGRSIATKEWNLHPQFLKTNNIAVTGILIEETEHPKVHEQIAL
jgi:hypothetical protein